MIGMPPQVEVGITPTGKEVERYRSRSPFNPSDGAYGGPHPVKHFYFYRKEEEMVKELLLEFISSEEASIAQRSFFSMGAMLTVVMLVAVTLLVMSEANAVPPTECYYIAEGSCDWIQQGICYGTPQCWYWEYWCNSPSRGCVMDDWKCEGPGC